MKTIKLFLASSDELQDDRNAIGNLVRRLDKIYEKRGIRVELFEWEDCDAAYNGERKQDEYNKAIKASDMFLALFHKKAGKYTVEEFDVATEEFRRHASPKVYMYCKDLDAGDTESQELTDFKDRLFKELGHYWCRYGNRDSLQLHLVMQLQLVENTKAVDLTMEDGTVTLDGMAVAKMDNLPFAAGNEEYRKMREELLVLPEKIDKARSRVEKFPDDDDLREDLQQKLNRYNNLKEEFGAFQKSLFDTARQITEIQQHQVNDLLRRAIDAFEGGDLKKANVLLDEIAHEAERHMAQLDRDRALVHQDIAAFLLQAKTVQADVSVPARERVDRAKALYEKSDEWASKSAYPEEKYVELLLEYGEFLERHALYDDSLAMYFRGLDLTRRLYGDNHPTTTKNYRSIGEIYGSQGDYLHALEYLVKALDIEEKVSGKEHPDYARVCNSIGRIYESQGDYTRALEYHSRALEVDERVLGKEHPDPGSRDVPLPPDSVYEFKVFDDPMEMYRQLNAHDGPDEKARMVAGYTRRWRSRNDANAIDWTLAEDQRFRFQWNMNGENWATRQGIERIGCIHTCQGMEFDYVGVIISRDITVSSSGELEFHPENHADDDPALKNYCKPLDTMSPADRRRISEILRNTYFVLLTRGMKGCYVYVEGDRSDPDVRRMIEYVKKFEVHRRKPQESES